MAKISNRWDYLAIAAIVLAVAGLVVYALPAQTGDVYPWSSLDSPCKPGDLGIETGGGLKNWDGTWVSKNWNCYEVAPFSSSSLPLAGVFGVAALLLLVLRLRPVTTRQNR
jgi:hypothetical protein